LVVGANGESCRDDSYFRYGGAETYEDDNGKSCRDWVASNKIERCELKDRDVYIKIYCPNTCALTRVRGSCGRNGKGVQIEKCLDNEWVDAICVENCQDDASKSPTRSPIDFPTEFPIISPTIFDCKTDPNRPALIKGVLQRVSNQIDLSNPSSYQFQAYNWIVNTDELKLCSDEESLIRRYILTLIYFQMGGGLWERTKTLDNYRIATPECSWYGVDCENSAVTNLTLSGINMSGSIPNEIGKLTSLKRLNFESNSVSGQIPDVIGMLSALEYLDLDRNLLTGPIPESLYSLQNLVWLDIDNNQFGGTISEKIGELSSIEILSLWNCNLSGTIPEEISKLEFLQDLSVDGNNLLGTLPQSICDLKTFGNLVYIASDCNGDPPKVVCTCCDECYPQ